MLIKRQHPCKYSPCEMLLIRHPTLLLLVKASILDRVVIGEVCGGVGWDMATAYAEPSPNLCAHVMLCQVAASVCSGAAHRHSLVC